MGKVLKLFFIMERLTNININKSNTENENSIQEEKPEENKKEKDELEEGDIKISSLEEEYNNLKKSINGLLEKNKGKSNELKNEEINEIYSIQGSEDESKNYDSNKE